MDLERDLIAGRKLAYRSLGAVLVLGLGKSGRAAARYCAGLLGTRVERLFIACGARTPEAEAFVASLPGEGVSWAFGDDALDAVEGGFDVCIASPGIPFWHPLYLRGGELSAELVSEVELAWRESAADSVWVAITGTNGKTTTTSLCAHVLSSCGFAASAVGNIGAVCLDAVAAGGTEVYVAEVSSYQLASTSRFAPDVAVVLNITPDHIHWHRTLDAYAAAKFKLLDNLGARGLAILGATDDVVRAKLRSLRASAKPAENVGNVEPAGPAESAGNVEPAEPTGTAGTAERAEPAEPAERAEPVGTAGSAENVGTAGPAGAPKGAQAPFPYIPLGTAEGIRGDMRARCGSRNAAFVGADDVLTVALDGRCHRLSAVGDLQVKGLHNAENALAAAAVAVALGADDCAVDQALCSFKPLEHRIEPCGSVSGVECYNDSKATNVDATVKALEAFEGQKLVVLLGGDDKGTDLDVLVEAVFAHARAAVCFGEAGPRIAEALDGHAGAPPGDFELVRAAHLADALDAALDLAVPGQAVLLSPACASFDEFDSFEHRGRVFKQLVADKARG